jgi:hypothetical protein
MSLSFSHISLSPTPFSLCFTPLSYAPICLLLLSLLRPGLPLPPSLLCPYLSVRPLSLVCLFDPSLLRPCLSVRPLSPTPLFVCSTPHSYAPVCLFDPSLLRPCLFVRTLSLTPLAVCSTPVSYAPVNPLPLLHDRVKRPKAL